MVVLQAKSLSKSTSNNTYKQKLVYNDKEGNLIDNRELIRTTYSEACQSLYKNIDFYQELIDLETD